MDWVAALDLSWGQLWILAKFAFVCGCAFLLGICFLAVLGHLLLNISDYFSNR
jgi:hypothetical protein